MLTTINEQEFETNAHNHPHSPNRFAVIPTTEKLNADARFTGKGVRIAFLDSGFFPHPDLRNRVVAFHDVSGEENEFEKSAEPLAVHWHGTQTIVVCAGDGSLSGGFYRGLASKSELIPVKVSENGRIYEENIERGLQWVLKHRDEYDIRVLNISLGGEMDVPCAKSKVDLLAEECVRQGIAVVVAAGNSAATRPIPPANAPSVITVGGFSDENQTSAENFNLYNSSFGTADDGTVKPEIIAPAMYVAAPILPKTKFYQTAELLSRLASAPDYKLRSLVREHWREAELPEELIYRDNETIRSAVEFELRERKIVAAHYQHVDGTSFAAPVTASVIAQMLEANPNLTPPVIKNILISTAERLAGFSVVRQGYGCINARRAVESALEETHVFSQTDFSPPRVEAGEILFFFHGDEANAVSVAGDFNDWQTDKILGSKQSNGIWRAAIKNLPAGKYRYKFFINETRWIEDASNCLKEPDGFGGFHSILHIK